MSKLPAVRINRLPPSKISQIQPTAQININMEPDNFATTTDSILKQGLPTSWVQNNIAFMSVLGSDGNVYIGTTPYLNSNNTPKPAAQLKDELSKDVQKQATRIPLNIFPLDLTP